MLERIKLALAIVRGHVDIVAMRDTEDRPYGYLIALSYDHAHDFLTDVAGENVRTRSVHIYEG